MTQLDLAAVRVISNYARRSLVRSVAIAVSRLGNGGIYILLPMLVFARLGKGGYWVVLIAVFNVALLHAFYPSLKRRVGRPRPYRVDLRLSSLLDVLDEHSFPSGHTMTLAATLVPIVYADPGLALYGAGLLVAMGFARVATAHHYPSDVIVGAVFAMATGYPLSAMFLVRG